MEFVLYSRTIYLKEKGYGNYKYNKNIKLVHPNDIALFNVGKFYYAYGKDAYILSYLFKYKLMLIEQYKVYSIAFPKASLPRVTAELENILQLTRETEK